MKNWDKIIHIPKVTRDFLPCWLLCIHFARASGSTVVDVSQWMISHSTTSPLPAGVPENPQKLILVTCHRRENIGAPMRSVALAIKHLSEMHPKIHFLFPLHPNPSVRENVRPVLTDQPGVSLCEPLNHDEFLSALRQSRFVLSDSGGVQEEATALGKPVLVLRRESKGSGINY